MRFSKFVEMELVPVSERWWALVVRGLAAIAFGVLAFVKPSISTLALVMLWGAYALVDGAFAVVLSVRGARVVPGWGWLLAGGILGIAAGVGAFVWPAITGVALLAVIATWAVLIGVAELVTAVRLRRYVRGEWMLAASGVLSIAFGVLMALQPRAGALAVTWLIGLYAVLSGVVLVALGIRLRRLAGAVDHALAPPRAHSHA